MTEKFTEEIPTTVTLKIKQEDGSKKNVPHEIEEIDGDQLEAAMYIMKEVMELADKEPSVRAVFEGLAEDKPKKNKKLAAVKDAEDTDEEEEAVKADKDFIALAINGFELLFRHLPGHAFRLLSVMSDIELKTLKSQKISNLPSIYNAVLEANDLPLLIERTKKSLAVTKVKMAWAGKLKTVIKKARR